MRKFLTVLGVAAALLLVGGIAVASVPDASGVIHGCRKNTDGSLRVIDTDLGQTCANGWTALNWSQTGPQGPAGVTGLEYITAQVVAVPQDTSSRVALCSTGKSALSGGYDVPPTIQIVGSLPNMAGGSANGWTVFAKNDTTSSVNFTVYAVCATVAA